MCHKQILYALIDPYRIFLCVIVDCKEFNSEREMKCSLIFRRGLATLHRNVEHRCAFTGKVSFSVVSSSDICSHFGLLENVISRAEEKVIVDYLSSLLKRKRYEGNHWDSVIVKYKELELHGARKMPVEVESVIHRLEALIKESYGDKIEQLQPPHVIDLDALGSIGPHVDSIKHSGGVLCGLSLMSSRIMELVPEAETQAEETSQTILRYHLPPRSLYFLEGPLRYDYTHSVLGKDDYDSKDAVFSSMAKAEDDYKSAVQRRLSIVFRDFPEEIGDKKTLKLRLHNNDNRTKSDPSGIASTAVLKGMSPLSAR